MPYKTTYIASSTVLFNTLFIPQIDFKSDLNDEHVSWIVLLTGILAFHNTEKVPFYWGDIILKLVNKLTR